MAQRLTGWTAAAGVLAWLTLSAIAPDAAAQDRGRWGRVSGGGSSASSPPPSGRSGGSQSAPAPSGGGGGWGAIRGGRRGSSSGDGGGRESGGGASDNGARRRGTSSGGRADGGSVRAVPSYSRPRDGQPSLGQAVVRQPGSSGTIFLLSNSYYGRGFYPWGYGGLGFGSYWGGYGNYWGGYGGFYDPWWYGYDPWPGAYATGGYDDYDGALRLKVKPRDASVYVDGYFAGQIDAFDGVFQRLRIEPGPHRIEIRADGYEPLVLDVRIVPGRTLTYEGTLRLVTP